MSTNEDEILIIIDTLENVLHDIFYSDIPVYAKMTQEERIARAYSVVEQYGALIRARLPRKH